MCFMCFVFFFKQKTAYELRISDWSSDVCSSDLPKFPGKSALEVIMTMLHSGGKFEGKAYATSGGLHGVGVSVVNALSADTVIEVARNKLLYRQRFSRGTPLGGLEELGPTPKRRGTRVSFVPDPEIFGEPRRLKPQRARKSVV